MGGYGVGPPWTGAATQLAGLMVEKLIDRLRQQKMNVPHPPADRARRPYNIRVEDYRIEKRARRKRGPDACGNHDRADQVHRIVVLPKGTKTPNE
jgi:hypothetical protein